VTARPFARLGAAGGREGVRGRRPCRPDGHGGSAPPGAPPLGPGRWRVGSPSCTASRLARPSPFGLGGSGILPIRLPA